MNRKFHPFALSFLLLAACHSQKDPQVCVSSTMASAGQVNLTGGVKDPGSRSLQLGDTVSTVIARNSSFINGKPTTIVLIRRGPDGKTRQLIQLDAAGKLMDPKQDWTLRDGDELLFPGGETPPSSNISHQPM